MIPQLPHPWRKAGREPGLRIEFSDLPVNTRGLTDGLDLIVLDRRLLQVERRCTLTHEQIHRERGHVLACGDPEEVWVQRETARRLILMEHLLHVLPWARDFAEAADGLWVTEDVFRARLDGLTVAERGQIEELAERVERTGAHS